MNENIIAWNVTNWVTVILMAAIGFFLIGWLTKLYQSKKGKPASSTVSSGNVITFSPGAAAGQ